MADITLSLTIDQIEGGLGIPIWTKTKSSFKHFHLQMNINFPFHIFTKCMFNTWMEFLAVFYVYFVCLSLTTVTSELLIINWKSKFHELLVFNLTTTVDIIKLHHKLTVLHRKLVDIIISQEIVEISCVKLAITISVKPAKGSIWFEIIQASQLAPILFYI